MRKRVFAMLLAAALLVSLMPTAVLAQTREAAQEATQVVTQEVAQEATQVVTQEVTLETARVVTQEVSQGAAQEAVQEAAGLPAGRAVLTAQDESVRTSVRTVQSVDTSQTQSPRRVALGVILLVAGVALLLYAFFMRGKKD